MRKGRRKHRFLMAFRIYKTYSLERADEVALSYVNKSDKPFEARLSNDVRRILKLFLYDSFLPPRNLKSHERKYGKYLRYAENLYMSKVYAARMMGSIKD